MIMRYSINEENSELRHRRFPLTDGIRKHLMSIMSSYDGDKTTVGYKRLNNLLSNEDGISYRDMKRIKNFFDNYVGTDNSDEYRLNGGDAMKWWVNNTLNTARAAIFNYKQAKKDAGISNAFRKTHQKERQIRKNKATHAKFDVSNRKMMSNKTIRYECVDDSETGMKLNELSNGTIRKIVEEIVRQEIRRKLL